MVASPSEKPEKKVRKKKVDKEQRAVKVKEADYKTDIEPGLNITKQIVPGQILLSARLNTTVFQTARKKVILNPTDIPLNIYSEMLLDPGILFPLTILKLPTLRSEFIYTNPDKDIEKFVRETMTPIWSSLKRDCLTAYEYGFAAMEKRFYRDSNNMARYRKNVAILPETVRIVVNNQGSLVGIVQHSARLKDKIEIPIWKLFIYTHQKRFGNHYGVSRLRAAYNAWILDVEMMKFHGISAQDHAVPTIITRAPLGKGTFTNEKGEDISINFLDFMQDVGESVHSNSTVSYPAGEEFSLSALDMNINTQWDFIKDHTFFDSAKGKAIFGFDELMRAGGGSYSKTKEIAGWLIEGIESIQEEIAVDYILPYMIRPLVMWNFWDGREKPPVGTFEFSPFTRNVRAYLEQIFETVVDDNSDIIDVEEMARILSVPLKEDPNNQENSRDKSTSLNSQREVENALKKVYNSALIWAKTQEGCEQEYIPQPKEDLTFIRDLSKKLWQRLKNNSIDNIGVNREYKKIALIAQQRVMDFIDSRTITEDENS